MSNKIKPLSDRVLIKPIPEDTTGELLIPDQAKEKPQKGEVIAAGEGKDGQFMRIHAGDTAYYRKGSGISFPGGLLMLRYGQDVIAVVENHFAASTPVAD